MKHAIVISITIIIILAAVAVVLIFDIGRTQPTIASFDECVQAGFPVQESYPARCVTSDGQSFTQIIETPVDPEATPAPVISPTASTTAANMITVTAPVRNASIKSPVKIAGQARGTWFFEASFPIRIVDAKRKTLGEGYAMATSEEWMTTNFVPFEGSVTFSKPTTEKGFIILMNDNPSGDPERSMSIELPITFTQ